MPAQRSFRRPWKKLAGHEQALGASSNAAVARLQTWWAQLASYDPHLVGEFDRRLSWLLHAARDRTAGPRTLAAALAGIFSWRGEPVATVLELLDYALPSA